jgi:hypothetical protein
MNMRDEVVTLAPGFGSAFDIAENGRRNRPAVGSGQEREHALFPSFQALQLAGSFGRHQDGAGAQHQTLRREGHRRAGEGGALARE